MKESLEGLRRTLGDDHQSTLIAVNNVGYLLKCRPGRPALSVERHFASFAYRAERWDTGRRVVDQVEWHPRD